MNVISGDYRVMSSYCEASALQVADALIEAEVPGVEVKYVPFNNPNLGGAWVVNTAHENGTPEWIDAMDVVNMAAYGEKYRQDNEA